MGEAALNRVRCTSATFFAEHWDGENISRKHCIIAAHACTPANSPPKKLALYGNAIIRRGSHRYLRKHNWGLFDERRGALIASRLQPQSPRPSNPAGQAYGFEMEESGPAVHRENIVQALWPRLSADTLVRRDLGTGTIALRRSRGACAGACLGVRCWHKPLHRRHRYVAPPAQRTRAKQEYCLKM